MDTTAVEASINGLSVPIAAIASAVRVVLVGLKGWKLLRRAF